MFQSVEFILDLKNNFVEKQFFVQLTFGVGVRSHSLTFESIKPCQVNPYTLQPYGRLARLPMWLKNLSVQKRVSLLLLVISY